MYLRQHDTLLHYDTKPRICSRWKYSSRRLEQSVHQCQRQNKWRHCTQHKAFLQVYIYSTVLILTLSYFIVAISVQSNLSPFFWFWLIEIFFFITQNSFLITLFYFSTQFHPEHMGGPRDLECLFDVFLNQVILHKRGQNR